MHSLQRAYYLCNIVLVVITLLTAISCARRSTDSSEPSPAPAEVTQQKPGQRRQPRPRHLETPAGRLPRLQEPVIQIGLNTEAKSLVISGAGVVHYSDARRAAKIRPPVIVSISYLTNIPIRYTVQLGSFATRSAAAHAQQALQQSTRLASFIFENPDLRLYQLRLGPFETKEKAQQAIESIKTKGYPDAFYVADSPATQALPELVLRDELGNLLFKTAGTVWFWTDDALLQVDQASFRGYASVFVNRTARLTVVNHLNFEDYLKGVVPNEIGPASATTYEALKAQAVAARTYAYKNLKQFEAEGFDLCATPRCQVYSGYNTEHALTSKAVEDTRGQIITYRGEAINALYTSTCGGRTENAEYMFDGWNYPYLQSVECYPEEKRTNGRNGTANLRGIAVAWPEAWLAAKSRLPIARRTDVAVSATEVSGVLSQLLLELGKKPCDFTPLKSLDWIGVANYFVEQLCWRAKQDSLLSSKDYQYFLRRLDFSARDFQATESFLFLFHEGILVPSLPVNRQFNPYRRLTRSEFYQALFNILKHYHQVNPSKGQVRAATEKEIQIIDELGVHSFEVTPNTFMFQRIGDLDTPRREIVCGSGDKIEYLAEATQMKILVCEIHQTGQATDRSSKFSFWQEIVTPQELTPKVTKYLDVGEVIDLEPLSYGRSERVYEMRIKGTRTSGVLRGIRVRWALGLRDNLFTIDRTYDASGRIKQFVFSGRGWGHGLGMCQIGALGLARQGKDYEEILSHYYTGIDVTRAY